MHFGEGVREKIWFIGLMIKRYNPKIIKKLLIRYYTFIVSLHEKGRYFTNFTHIYFTFYVVHMHFK